MTRRTWDAKANARIVLEGLQGRPVAERCNEHQLNPSQDDPWRDQVLAHASKAFEVHQDAPRDARLAREPTRLTALVGELTLEFKKSDAWLG